MNAALLPIGKNKFQKILAEEVIYCEASTGCTNIHLLNGRIFMVYRTLSFVELQLQVPYIVRISRSYLLNLNHVVGVQTGCEAKIEVCNEGVIRINEKIAREVKRLLLQHIDNEQ